jgi:serine/threonine protein kinase
MAELPTQTAARDRQLQAACAELERRLRAGEGHAAEAVLAEYPKLAADPESALQVVYEELVLRERLGERPAYEEYYGRFPHWQDELRKSFDVHEAWVRGVSKSWGPAPEAVETSPASGRGRYELLGEIGRGGMGVVYRSRQPGLKRPVALKMILSGDYASAEDRRRFRTEGEAIARLQHPNIVQVYEVGEQDGRPFLALEYVDGGSLASQLNGTPLPSREAAQLVETLARAVQYAHEQGVLHRDLKPANILLRRKSEIRNPKSEINPNTETLRVPSLGFKDSDFEFVSDFEFRISDFDPKITDFGLAKRLPGEAGMSASASLTETGQVLGTPSYMAPEQARGELKAIGPATDVYALGAILYECLTGRPPFKGETALETLLLVREQEPVPPQRLQPKVPRDLETICLKCLEKDPSRRYARAAELAEDLRRFQAGEAIRARPIGVWSRTGKWARRRPALAALVTVSGLAAVTLAAVVLSYNARLRATNQDLSSALAATREQQQRAEDNFRLARAAVDQYALKVSADPRLRESFRPLRKELLQTAVPFYEKFVEQHGDDPLVQADLATSCLRLVQLLAEVDDPAKAIARCQQARDILTRLVREAPANEQYRKDLAGSLNSLGNLNLATGQSAAAEEAYRAAIDQLEQLEQAGHGADSLTGHRAQAWGNLGVLYRQRNQPERAQEALHESLRLHRELAARHPDDARHAREVVRGLVHVGMLYRGMGKYPEADQAYQEAITRMRPLLAKHPQHAEYQFELARGLNNLTTLYLKWNRPAEGEKPIQESLELYRRLAARYPEVTQYQSGVAFALTNLGKVYRLTGRPTEAETASREALAVRKHLVAKYPRVHEHASFLGAVAEELARLLRDTGRIEEALPYYTQALATVEAVLREEPNHFVAREVVFEAHQGQARALTRLKRHAEAQLSWERALALTKGPAYVNLRLDRATERARVGDHARATAEARELATGKDLTGAMLYNLAGIYALAVNAAAADADLAATERTVQAEEYSQRALELLGRARQAGYFNNPRQVERFQKDRRFERLHAREAFRAFVTELDRASP